MSPDQHFEKSLKLAESILPAERSIKVPIGTQSQPEDGRWRPRGVADGASRWWIAKARWDESEKIEIRGEPSVAKEGGLARQPPLPLESTNRWQQQVLTETFIGYFPEDIFKGFDGDSHVQPH